MPDVEPDWKPEKGKASSRKGTNRARRIVDRKASKTALLTERHCVACGRPGANAHHVVPKGSPHFGDDVVENLVTLCGSGTSGCHGAHHGNPYKVEVRKPSGDHVVYAETLSWEKRDAEWVNRKIGQYLAAARPDVIRYVRKKLGRKPGDAWLVRTYYLPEALG